MTDIEALVAELRHTLRHGESCVECSRTARAADALEAQAKEIDRLYAEVRKQDDRATEAEHALSDCRDEMARTVGGLHAELEFERGRCASLAAAADRAERALEGSEQARLLGEQKLAQVQPNPRRAYAEAHRREIRRQLKLDSLQAELDRLPDAATVAALRLERDAARAKLASLWELSEAITADSHCSHLGADMRALIEADPTACADCGHRLGKCPECIDNPLAAVPADVLREHDERVWDEGFAAADQAFAVAMRGGDELPILGNPYRRIEGKTDAE